MLEVHTEIPYHPIELREELIKLTRVALFVTAQRFVALILSRPISLLLLLAILLSGSFAYILSHFYLRCQEWKNRQLIHRLIGNVALCVED